MTTPTRPAEAPHASPHTSPAPAGDGHQGAPRPAVPIPRTAVAPAPAPSVLALAQWLRRHGLDAVVVTADGEAIVAREARR